MIKPNPKSLLFNSFKLYLTYLSLINLNIFNSIDVNQ